MTPPKFPCEMPPIFRKIPCEFPADSPLSLSATKSGTYQLGLKLFGAIRLKNIQLDVVEQRYAIPCGFPIGIYLKSDGILVVGTGTVTDETGKESEPALGTSTGDYIEAINGHPDKQGSPDTELRHVGGAENVFLKSGVTIRSLRSLCVRCEPPMAPACSAPGFATTHRESAQ